MEVPSTSYQAALWLAIVELHRNVKSADELFNDAVERCRGPVKALDSFLAHYSLATAEVGQAVCDPLWTEEPSQAALLAKALADFEVALGICAAKGIVSDVLRSIEMIQGAGVGGLDSVTGLLQAQMPNSRL